MANRTPKLTHKRLLEVLFYNVITGVFTWRVSMSSKKPKGCEAGVLTKDGYLRIMIDGERFLGHRLAWFWVHGEWPSEQIDHRSVNNLDNSLVELRQATQSQNQANRGPTRSNRSGIKGVCFVTKAQKWRATIREGGRNKFLGEYDTAEQAAKAYAKEADRIFGEFARLK